MSSLAQDIRERLDALTASERRAGRALLANYPVLGLGTVAEFAARAGVSSPSVLRFTARLGFSSYSEFQQKLRHELEEQLQTPLTKSPAAASGADPPASRFAEAACGNIAETFAHLPAAEFDAVARLIGDSRRPLHLIGGRFTDALALYMAAHLRIVRPLVRHLGGQQEHWRDQLLDMGRRDVLVVFDVRRYQSDIVAFAEAASRQGATIILLTDQWLSPAARFAAYVLPARIAAPSAWDSSVALMTLVEALIAAVTAGDWRRSQKRMEAIEALRRGT